MFTKEKLEKWIKSLDTSIDNLNNGEVNDVINIWQSDIKNLEELLLTLEALHKSITSDGSI